jgi:DNA-binding LytR/AlgR family response regulator
MSNVYDSAKVLPPNKAPRDWRREARDWRRRLGISGDSSGTNGKASRTWLYMLGIAAAISGVVTTANVITLWHGAPARGLLAPVITEGSSFITSLLSFWIIWLAWCVAPPTVRPRWKLLVHAPAAILYSLFHVSGFVLLRKLAFDLAGTSYEFAGNTVREFLYEFSKDTAGYVLFLGAFTLVKRLLNPPLPATTPISQATFDIRDGARVSRVRLDDIVAITSAGNYVEFKLRGAKTLLMRSALSAIEQELAPRGFSRTHRSWLVNAKHVRGLVPEGSGDYKIELESFTVPLSRRFPEALAKLRGT